MENVDHIHIQKPLDETRIWRYIDLAKFMSLLERKALFFSQAKYFEDKWEGSLIEWLEGLPSNESAKKSLNDIYNSQGSPWLYTAINCWHIADDESLAMWKLYTGKGSGIAIVSTVGQLEKSLDKSSELMGVSMGKVNYHRVPQFAPSVYSNFDVRHMFFYKSPDFIHEKEFRVVIQKHPHDWNKDKGAFIQVDLNMLLEKIVVAPHVTAPYESRAFTELISAIAKTYNIGCNVLESQFNNHPFN